MPPISTPCLRICVLDEASGLCLGCGRTAAEIARWGLLSEPERQAIMAELGGRLAAAAERLAQEDRTCRE